jgi:hypothetical protein
MNKYLEELLWHVGVASRVAARLSFDQRHCFSSYSSHSHRVAVFFLKWSPSSSYINVRQENSDIGGTVTDDHDEAVTELISTADEDL